MMIYSYHFPVFNLLRNILFSRFKSRICDPTGWLRCIQTFIISKFFTLHSVPECFIRSIFKLSGFSGFWNSAFIVHSNTSNLSWCRVIFKNSNNVCCRTIQILYSPLVPPRTILCSDVLLFNIKRSLSMNPCESLSVELFINPVKNQINYQKAKSINISQIETCENLETTSLDEVIESFLKSRHYCYENDMILVNLNLYSPLKMKKNVYFSILEISCEDDKLEDTGFLITEETSVYQANNVQSFVPPSKYEFKENNDISSITTVIPVGMECHYKVLSRWFLPFLRKFTNTLKPVFVLSGISGVGKKLLLKVIAKKLGVHYCKVDCNDLISSTSAQIQANFKTSFNRIKKSGPSIVHLCNVNLLCYDCDSNDTAQLISALSDHITSFESIYSSVFVITCEDFTTLPDTLTALVLAHHHVMPPNDMERKSLLIWLANRYSICWDQQVIDYLITETTSFVLADLHRLLALGDLQRYKSNRTYFTVQDFTSSLENLNKVEKAKVGEVEWEDVGGVEDIKKAVLSSIETGRFGGLRRTGLLLHGPPGTGKTLLARAVANQVSAAFIPVKGPELLNMYIGQSEANVRQVFSRAKDAAPCILFFDELDSLAPSRGNQSSGGVMDRVVSQLLSEMDSLEVKDGVFVLAATNRPDLIDPALLRPGRLDKLIYIGPFESKDAKFKVLRAITRKFILEENFDFDKIVNLLPAQVTGAQLNAICYDAWMHSARQLIKQGDVQNDTKVVVSMQNFISSLQTTNINF